MRIINWDIIIWFELIFWHFYHIENQIWNYVDFYRIEFFRYFELNSIFAFFLKICTLEILLTLYRGKSMLENRKTCFKIHAYEIVHNLFYEASNWFPIFTPTHPIVFQSYSNKFNPSTYRYKFNQTISIRLVLYKSACTFCIPLYWISHLFKWSVPFFFSALLINLFTDTINKDLEDKEP